jgi:hypothetical protein
MIHRDINVIKSTFYCYLGHFELMILFHSQLFHVLPVITILAVIMVPADLS